MGTRRDSKTSLETLPALDRVIHWRTTSIKYFLVLAFSYAVYISQTICNSPFSFNASVLEHQLRSSYAQLISSQYQHLLAVWPWSVHHPGLYI